MIPRSAAFLCPMKPITARAWAGERSKHSSAGSIAPMSDTLWLVSRSQATPFSTSPDTPSTITFRRIRHAPSIRIPFAAADAVMATA